MRSLEFCRSRLTKRVRQSEPSIRKFPNDLASEPLPDTAIVFANLLATVSNPHSLFQVQMFR